MKFLYILFLIGSAFALPTEPETTIVLPNPNQVYIKSITYGGTGCPQGTAGKSISSDRTTFTLIFDEYIASIGPGIPLKDNRKTCQLNVDLHYPSGYQYSVWSTDYRGFANLDKGIRGTQKANYYFAGSTQQATAQSKFYGPLEKNYLFHDEIGFASRVWSPCGVSHPLNIQSEIRLDRTTGDKKAEGLLTTDSIDGKVTFKCGIQWRRCTK